MPVDEVAWNVVDVVFAGHGPTIGTVFPHVAFLRGATQVGWETSGAIVLLFIQAHVTGKGNAEAGFFTTSLQGMA
jgi:hypothetical protein